MSRSHPALMIRTTLACALGLVFADGAQAQAQAHAHTHTSHPAASLPREPIPAITQVDREAAFPPIDHGAMEHASAINHLVRVERLEAWDAEPGIGQAWKARAWIGSDLHRLWLRSEGERIGGRTDAAELEVLYGRSLSPWWDLVAGLRHDLRPADSRSWATLGLQGLAPYRFELGATAYLSGSGQVQIKAEAEYELLLTQRLILQPSIEATASLNPDPAHGDRSGLNALETGLRLRYEINRRFAPYLGLVHERRYRRSGTSLSHPDAHPRDTRLVAGIRLWF